MSDKTTAAIAAEAPAEVLPAVTLDELERFSGARGWVDVAKGWRDEELS